MHKTWEPVVEVDGSLVVPIEDYYSDYGHTELHVCVKFDICSGRSEFWIYPVQSPIDTPWHHTNGDTYFTISTASTLRKEGVWMVSWCEEHQTQSLYVYVPRGTKFLEINNFGIHFHDLI